MWVGYKWRACETNQKWGVTLAQATRVDELSSSENDTSNAPSDDESTSCMTGKYELNQDTVILNSLFV